MQPSESETLKFGTKTLFTFNTYMHLCETTTTNFVICPFFVESLFVVILLGAEGETATEIKSNLDCLICGIDIIGVAVQEALSALLDDSSYLLNTLIKFYVKENCEIKEDFKIIAATVAAAEVENIAFGEGAADAINAWIEIETGNKIHKIVAPEDLNDTTSCVIVNSLFFKINWEKKFLGQLTHSNKFYKTGNKSVKVKMMYGRFDLKYCESEEVNARLLVKELQGGASMVIVLPNEEENISNIDKKMDIIFNMDIEKFKTELVDLLVPKFKIDTKLDYKAVFESRGIKKVFKENEADLEGIAGNRNDLYVNSVIQKVSIDVNEDGVATNPPEPGPLPHMCIMFPPIPTIQFTVNRPFAFFIKIKGKIIFAGKVVDPRENSSESQK